MEGDSTELWWVKKQLSVTRKKLAEAEERIRKLQNKGMGNIEACFFEAQLNEWENEDDEMW